MRVLLLRPNSGIDVAPPPLGLMYIAAYLRNRDASVQIRIVDARSRELSTEALKGLILDYAPELIGLTSMHVERKETHALAGLARQVLPQVKIAIGGPYPSADYQEALQDENIDFAVIGEGEETFSELVSSGCGGYRDLENIRGLAYRQDGRIKFNGQRDFIADLDKLPLPSWDLLDLGDYFYGKRRSLENPLQVHKRAVPILSSRGCPYQCTYCHNIFGKKFRARSAENVATEIELLRNNYGVREIEFLDDSFNMDKSRAQRIFNLLIARGVKVRICFSNGIRLDRVDDELLGLMKRAGTYRINYGIESASKRVQQIMKKNLDIDIAHAVIDKTVERGILCGGFFMFGFPTETEDEVMQSIDFAVASRLHTAVFSIVTPFPSTEMYRQAGELIQGRGYYDVQSASCNLSAIPDRRLEELRILAYRKFYFNPLRALRIFIAAPAKWPVFKNFWEVLRVAFFKKVLYAAATEKI
jgi:radical SAM superfamily enzyme YgiQ (UPF0313 family)